MVPGFLPSQKSDWLALVQAIDRSPHEVTDWEATFLESLLKKKPKMLSPKQQKVLTEMVEKYLPS